MINRIIDFSINNKLIIGLLTLTLVAGGIWSMTKVPIDAVPDITNNQVQVITQAPNLGTIDIEQFVTYPVELAMANLPGVTEIRSVSRFGLSVVTIVFEDKMETYLPRQLVAEKLAEVKEDIPQGFGEPTIGPISTGLSEIYQYTLEVDSLYRDRYSASDLRTIQDWIIRRQMAMVPGVVEVNAFGGSIKQYEVVINPDALRAMDFTIADIFKALEMNNQNTGGAYIEKDHKANFIRGEGLAQSLEDIEQTVVKNIKGMPVTIGDVAKVRFGSAVRYGALTKEGKGEAVGGMILMLKGANSNDVIAAVRDRMAEIQKNLPEGISIEPYLDRSTLIGQTTRTVSTNLIEGALIVIFVLVFLLGNWRGGLIVASTIPLSLLFAFILMNAFDVWANLMSLGAIDFGIIVDGAVIIVESTVFLLHGKVLKGHRITAEVRDDTAREASFKMMNTAFFGQLIILIVFIPILALEGVEGKMFKPMALTFMFAMLGVMLLCLTYVPMMSAWLLKVDNQNKLSWGDKLVLKLENLYESMLKKSLNRAGGVVLGALVLLGLAIFTFTRMGGEFIPQLDEGDIAFHVIIKPGSSLSEMIETTTRVEQMIKSNFPEVEHVLSRIGVAEVATDPMPMDVADCFLIFKPGTQWVSASGKEELVEKIKEKLEQLPGVNYEFTQPIEMRFNELISGVREDIAVKLFGEDLDVLAAKAEEMGKIIATVPGVADLKVEATKGLPQISIQYDRARLARYGLNIEELNTLVQSAFAGGKAGVIFEGEKRFDLVVRLDEEYRKSIDDLSNLYISLPNDAQIPLREVAEIGYQSGPMQISRDNTNRRTYVGINVRGRDIKSLVREIREKLDAQLDLPPGYFIRYGGAFENLERATQRLQIVVPMALGLIFLLIFIALRSIRQTIMICLVIPLAAIGGVFSLWLRGMPFSISAGIGFVVLFGIAVLNGLVLINGWNELKKEGGADLDQRVRQGAKRRIRPVLLTASTDILGFLPMAISTSAGAEVQRPLATVVIGGMLSATLLTLFVLPILYKWIESHSLKQVIGKKPVAAIVLFLIVPFFGAQDLRAQSQDTLNGITLEEALTMAKSRYPKIQAARLDIDQQQALKKTAWDLGNTRIFTNGEEIGEGDEGVFTTIGFQQQNMDVFGIAPKKRLQNERIALAEAALNLSELELTYQVKISYGGLYTAIRQYQLYVRIDSMFIEFARAAKVRYEAEETSRLAYLAAFNQSRQIAIQKDQAYRDYNVALQKFNLWLVSDTLFTISVDSGAAWNAPLQVGDYLGSHPLLAVSNRQWAVAENQWKVARSVLLPDLNLQYGIQQVDRESGFRQFQAGISIPLFFMKDQGTIQAAKIRMEMAEQNLNQTRLELQNSYQNAVQEYRKWLASWEYYRTEALSLSAEQREGAFIAYREGAIDYIAFLQNVKDAIQIELNAWQALEQYINSRSQLEYLMGQ